MWFCFAFNDTEHFFICLLAVYILWENVSSNPLPIFKWGYYYYCYLDIGILYILWVITCYQIVYKYFLLLQGFPFHSVHLVLFCTKVLDFSLVPFISVLVASAFGVMSKKLSPKPPSVRKLFSSVFF